jgi:hypothetical protein
MKTTRIFLKTAVMVFVTIKACISTTVGQEQTSSFQELLKLANTPPEDYPGVRDEFVRSGSTNRFDVLAATKASWQAGVMALIVNARRDYPEAFAEIDNITNSIPNIRGRFRYGYIAHGPAAEASVLERLCKGGRLFGTDRMGKSEYGELPSYGRGQLVESVFMTKTERSAPDDLWLVLAGADVSLELRAVALYSLRSNESEAARAIALSTLTNPKTTSLEKDALLRGWWMQRPNQPHFVWDVLTNTLSAWIADPSANTCGCLLLLESTNQPAYAVMRPIVLDAHAAEDARVCALVLLPEPSGTSNIPIFRQLLEDRQASARLKVAAAERLSGYPAAAVRQAVRELDLSALDNIDIATQIRLFKGLTKESNQEAVRFLQELSERPKAPPGIRKAAAEAATNLSNQLKVAPK